MVASPDFADFLRDQLAPLGRITMRRMFGKTGVFCDGVMLGMVTDNMLYLRVDDIGATVERLRARGVVVESEPHVIFRHDDDTLGPAGTDEWQAFVRDSEGNLVGLVSQQR